MLTVQQSGKFILGCILLRLGQFLLANVFQGGTQVRLDVEVVQDDQGILCVVPGRREKPFGAIAGHYLDFGALLLGKTLKEGVKVQNPE